MPYRLLNIGQQLFLLPNTELKQKVRILERVLSMQKLALFLIEHIYIYIYGISRVSIDISNSYLHLRLTYFVPYIHDTRCLWLLFTIHDILFLVFMMHIINI